MTNKCNRCGKYIATVDSAKCSRCTSTYHQACVNISPKGLAPTKWQCRDCKGKTKSLNNPPDPPVPDMSEDTFVDATMTTDGSQTLVKEIKLLRTELSTFGREMAQFRQELTHINTAINDFNTRVDKIEERLSTLELRITDCPNASVVSTEQDIITQLRRELHEKEQENLLNDVVIQGLAEKPAENTVQLVSLVASKIGITLDDRDIVSSERAGPRRGINEGEERPHPRPLIVRLTRRAVRDQLLRAARVRRTVDSTGITDGQPRRFYINERLTRANVQLFFKVREEGRRKAWKFIWTNAGRIFVRKDAKSMSHRIRSENDINKFFGVDQIVN